MNLELLTVQLQMVLTQLTEVKVLQARNNASLDEHMRRTAALETHLENIRTELSPLKAHVAAWAGVSKALLVIVAITTIVGSLAKVLL